MFGDTKMVGGKKFIEKILIPNLTGTILLHWILMMKMIFQVGFQKMKILFLNSYIVMILILTEELGKRENMDK